MFLPLSIGGVAIGWALQYVWKPLSIICVFGFGLWLILLVGATVQFVVQAIGLYRRGLAVTLDLSESSLTVRHPGLKLEERGSISGNLFGLHCNPTPIARESIEAVEICSSKHLDPGVEVVVRLRNGSHGGSSPEREVVEVNLKVWRYLSDVCHENARLARELGPFS